MCKIKYHTGFKERRECLDKHESLRITILVETQEGSVTEEIHVREHWKSVRINFGRVSEARKAKERKSQRIKCWRFEMLQKMGDTWPWKCESLRGRLQRYWSKYFYIAVTKIIRKSVQCLKNALGYKKCPLCAKVWCTQNLQYFQKRSTTWFSKLSSL